MDPTNNNFGQQPSPQSPGADTFQPVQAPETQAITDIATTQPTVGVVAPEPGSNLSQPSPEISPQDFSSNSQSSGLAAKFGTLALTLPVLALILAFIIIFWPSIIASETLFYVWLAVFLTLGGAGVGLGLAHLKASERIHLPSLMGVIIGTVVFLSAATLGTYYIKIELTINSIENQYKSSSQSVDSYSP